MAITAFFSRSPGLLKWGPRGSASLGHGPHSSIFSPTDWTSCHLGYIIIWRQPTSCERHNFALNSTPWQSRSPLISRYLRPDAPVINTGAFLLLTAWPSRRSICNRCFDWQRFGHHQDRCARPPVCGRCSETTQNTRTVKKRHSALTAKKITTQIPKIVKSGKGKSYIQNEIHQKHYFLRNKENNRSSKILWNVKKIHIKYKPTRTPNIQKQPNWNETRSNYPTYKCDENTNPKNENYNKNSYWKKTILWRKFKHQKFTNPKDTNKIKQGEPKCPLLWSGLYC